MEVENLNELKIKDGRGKQQIVPCTKEEIEAIINAAREDDYCYTLFKVASKTGRRIGEFYDVKVMDINFEEKVMKTKILKRRVRVEREAILDDDLLYLIQRYITTNHLKLDDYLFRKVGRRQIQNLVKKYAKAAGIEHPVVFHNFRHYFVTELVKAGWNYEKIAKLTGHGTPGTLVAYDHMVASDVAEDAREALKNL